MPVLQWPSNNLNTQFAAKLGATDVTVTRFEGTEGLSQLFCLQVEFSSAVAMTAQNLIYKPAYVGVRSRISNNPADPVRERIFAGRVNRFLYRGQVAAPGTSGNTVGRYQAQIVPWLWFLTQKSDCRIFQQKTIPQIIEAVLNPHSTQYDLSRLTATYATQEYRVQYRESDFAFVSRLMEEAGIYYYFDQTADKEFNLILADSVTGYFNSTEPTPLFGEHGTASSRNHVQEWDHGYEFQPAKYALADFDYNNPDSTIRADSGNSPLNLPGSAISELYDYPGGFADSTTGQTIARIRIGEEETSYEVVRGAGVSPCFAAGSRFTLKNHPSTAENATFVVVSVEHDASGRNESLAAGQTPSYKNRFTCIPAPPISGSGSAVTIRPFRPPRTTPRQVVRGIQTAIVTGPSGEEHVDTDSLGRVHVQFHWDREGRKNENSSCWIRVSQDWAGNGFGSVFLPHIGNEVIVSFLEGDPDRPLITGCVYNASNKPPETLPDNKHRTIVAQDRVGNIIALDADEKRVDIQNAEDRFELTIGTSAGATIGMNHSFALGLDSSVNLGAAAGIALAASMDFSLGYSVAVAVGGSYSYNWGGSFANAKGAYVNAGDMTGQFAYKNSADFSSNQAVTLAGGSGPQNSVLYATSDGLTLSYGMTDPKFYATPALGVLGSMFGTAVVGTLGVAAAGAAAFLGAKASEKEDFDGYAGGAIASGIGSIALSIGAGYMLHKFQKAWSLVKQPVHGGALPSAAQLRLAASGAKLLGSSEVVLSAGIGGAPGTVRVSGNEFRVASPESVFRGNLTVRGVLQSANILDIGQPAAAAAAAAQVAAELARDQAQQAAQNAQHQAAQALDTANAIADNAPYVPI